MTAATATHRRVLPRGWGDLLLQLGIWFGFLAAYQVARGDGRPPPGSGLDAEACLRIPPGSHRCQP